MTDTPEPKTDRPKTRWQISVQELKRTYATIDALTAQVAELQRELAIANRLIRRNVGALTESLKDDLDRLGDHQ